MIKVLLAEDHRVVRDGLRALLQREPDMRVVGEIGDGLEAVGLVESMRPDVLVVDLMLPGLGGIEVTRLVRRRATSTRVVVLSMHAAEAFVIQALEAGASGYVLKDAGADQLLVAIRKAVAGKRHLSPPLTEASLADYQDRVGPMQADPYEALTARERQVLVLTAQGETSRETAARLGISPRTAEWHRAQVLRKLGLRGQAELTQFAMRRGLLGPEPSLPGPRPEPEDPKT
ncbi:MAG: response regulator transcription factor [Vicinamibacteria bacterium]|nr:response regulator transcription factor [Vicinamibacteria bacterium]